MKKPLKEIIEGDYVIGKNGWIRKIHVIEPNGDVQYLYSLNSFTSLSVCSMTHLVYSWGVKILPNYLNLNLDATCIDTEQVIRMFSNKKPKENFHLHCVQPLNNEYSEFDVEIQFDEEDNQYVVFLSDAEPMCKSKEEIVPYLTKLTTNKLNFIVY